MAGQALRLKADQRPGVACPRAVVTASNPASLQRGTLDLAILVYDLRSSGVVHNVLRIAETARGSGLRTELWVIHAGGALLEQLPGSLAVRSIGTPSHGLPRALHSLLNLPRLVRLLRTHRPALLLSAGNHIHAFACLAHRLAHVPEIRLIGRVSNALAAAVVSKWPGVAGVLLRRAAMMVERILYRSMHHLVVVSWELAHDLVHLAGVDPRRITVIANGVDLTSIDRQGRVSNDHPWFAAGAAPVVVAVGRHCRQKNFPHLLRAFARLRGRLDARLVILGEGDARALARLQRLACELGVSQDVWFAGYQANPYRFLARARLFVLSSRWEGASNALIEALACGCPVVATACPTGIREVLTDHHVGALVPIDDVGALAEAMQAKLVQPHDPESSRCRAAAYRLPQTLARYLALLHRELALVRDEDRANDRQFVAPDSRSFGMPIRLTNGAGVSHTGAVTARVMRPAGGGSSPGPRPRGTRAVEADASRLA